MNKIIWINFLHMYQPPWQDKGVVERVSIESYDYLITLFEKYPSFKCSLNITGNLIEQLEEINPKLLKRLQKIVKSGQVELTGSSKYHALLPLLSTKEAKRQIQLNQEVLNKYFDIKKIKGFYLPEMAFSLSIAKIIKGLGFKWLILDEIHSKDRINNEILYKVKGIGLNVVFRNRKISKSYPAEVIFKKLKKNFKNQNIITATDAEIYGHFHEDWQGHLEKILIDKNVEVKTISEYTKSLKEKKNISLRSASWESSIKDIKNNIPYILWDDPKNIIHKDLWKLVKLADSLVNKYKKDKNYYWARLHLDKGVSSCTFWWATAKKPSPFSPLTWNPDLIDNGSEELIRSIRSLDKASVSEKIKAEKLYISIKKNTWFSHWRKYNK